MADRTATLKRAGRTLLLPAQWRKRVLSFLVDWIVWGYVAYGIMYLLNHYWYTVHVDWYGTLTLPPWGWPLAILGTMELAVWSRALGWSLGLRALGMGVTDAEGNRPKLAQRILRGLSWHLGILSVPVTMWSRRGRLGHDRLTRTQVGPMAKRSADVAGRAWRTQWCVVAVFLIAFTVLLGWLIIGVNIPVLVRRAPEAGRIWGQLVSPDFEYLFHPDPVFARRGLSYSIFDLVVVTIFMALLATVLGGMAAFPLSFMGARNIMGFNAVGWGLYSLVRGFFNVFRSIETILWASVFAVWVGWGTFAGVLALTIHTIAALGKLYSEQVESIDPGPLEAIVATGGSRWQVVRYAVIPQVLPSAWAFTLYRWDINVRMSTIIALVGGGGIGDMLFFYKNEGAWSKVGAVVMVIVAVVWTMDYISGRLRERIA
ncbi:MAG: phosphonate ABC transporter, permease protein PhnE [Candidatus Bipolaricaulota bacterium]